MFIKLTKNYYGDRRVIYVKSDEIFLLDFRSDCLTEVTLNGDNTFFVEEGPEEIMNLIKEATTPTFSFEGSNIDGGNIGLQVKNCCHTSEASK